MDKLDIDTLKYVPSDLSNLKNKVDIDKLENTPVDLSNLSDVVINEVVKKTEYNELVEKVNAIQTTDIRKLVKQVTITKKLMKLKMKITN